MTGLTLQVRRARGGSPLAFMVDDVTRRRFALRVPGMAVPTTRDAITRTALLAGFGLREVTTAIDAAAAVPTCAGSVGPAPTEGRS